MSEVSKNLKKLFVSGAVLIMIASTGADVNNVSAKHRYHYHISRIYRHHPRRHRHARRVSRYYVHRAKHHINHRRAHHYYVSYKGIALGWTKSHRAYNRDMKILKEAVKTYGRSTTKEIIHGHKHRSHKTKMLKNHNSIDSGFTTNYHTHKEAIQKDKNVIKHSQKPVNRNPQSKNSTTPQEPIKYQKPAETTVEQNVNTNLQEMKQQTLAEINSSRQEGNEAPLQESNMLNNIAKVRAQQTTQVGENHVDSSTGQSYNYEVAQKLGYGKQYLGENLDPQILGDHYTYYNVRKFSKNGYDMANTANDDMLNHDSFCNNGHRNNILDNSSTQVGVGTAYDPSSQYYYIAEEFK